MTEVVAKTQLRRAGDYNKSRIYFLPMLEIPKATLDPYLWECYIKDINYPELKERMFLLFDITKTPLSELNTLYEELKHHEFYDREYWLTEEKLIMIFIIPSHHLSNYKLLLKGQYSKVSDGFKNYLMVYHQQQNGSQLDGVLYKRDEYRKKLEKKLDATIDSDAELSSIIEDSNEFQLQIKTK